jgi:hypothetical protein
LLDLALPVRRISLNPKFTNRYISFWQFFMNEFIQSSCSTNGNKHDSTSEGVESAKVANTMGIKWKIFLKGSDKIERSKSCWFIDIKNKGRTTFRPHLQPLEDRQFSARLRIVNHKRNENQVRGELLSEKLEVYEGDL